MVERQVERDRQAEREREGARSRLGWSYWRQAPQPGMKDNKTKT